jgi:8-oxo-dGTP pyrophosphatase MutT (NUDIX family)
MMTKSKTIKLEVGTKALLQNAEGKFLLLKRTHPYLGEEKPGWDIPGGRIVPGETQLQALQREILEETGLTISQVVGVLSVQDILRSPGRHVVRVTYLAVCTDTGTITLDKKEHSEYQWLSLEELASAQLDTYLDPIIQQLNKRFT